MLEPITNSSLAPFHHGFFTRNGGASSGIFQGLNCGYGSTDQHDIVTINRDRVAQAMGVAPNHLMSVHQVHSADVAVVETKHDPSTRADAMVSKKKGTALSVLTADCQPVLFCDEAAGVIGAAHAGWRGCFGGVLEATINAMITLGSMRQNICAVIGPSISQKYYEVGPEFVDRFINDLPETARFFAKGQLDRALFNLPAYGLWRLRAQGLKSAEWTGHCTYNDGERFFSYRRATHQHEADYGRQISAIAL
ncbi:MAG: YfiH family protein [Paracoccaceae bacterium]|jgi:YfiH family protein